MMEPRRLISTCSPAQQAPSRNGARMPRTHSSAMLVPPPPVASPPVASPPIAPSPPVSPRVDRPPKSARRKHSKVVEPPTIEGHSSDEEPPAARPRKKVRGICRGIKSGRIAESYGHKIKVIYKESFRGAEKCEVHSLLSHDIGAIVRTHCKMNMPSFNKLSKSAKSDLRDFLTVNYDINYDHWPTSLYIDGIFAQRFKDWKHECYKYFQEFSSPEEARASPPSEFSDPDRVVYWRSLCDHFMTPTFQKRSSANKSNRRKKKLNHHGGAKMFVYRIQHLREKMNSKFPAIDNFKDVYVTPDNPQAVPLYEKMQEKISEFIQNNESQCTPDTPLDQIPLPDPIISVNILTETLQELGPSAGSYVRGMGRGMVRDVRHRLSSSTSQALSHSLDEVNELKGELSHSRNEVKELKNVVNQLLMVLSAKGITSQDDIVVPQSMATDAHSDSPPT